eukprot:TRINITY_DN2540_c0_g1_i1.p1 TRINITY_DN2540_c0_g1~~TRINITY_DN2540_c0_g1_i1.p1  ORF type:complete len:457 (+),score=119.67 TRINITY_DN2540_c0_g1_i1:29-1372(+)
MNDIVERGDNLLILHNFERFYQVIVHPSKKFKVDRKEHPSILLEGLKYNACYEFTSRKQIKMVKFPQLLKGYTDNVTVTGGNEEFFDSGTAQQLSDKEINLLKTESKVDKEELIKTIVDNSSTFEKKTELAQQKYIEKKIAKHVNYIVIYRPSWNLLVRSIQTKNPGWQDAFIAPLGYCRNFLNPTSNHNSILVWDAGVGLLTAGVWDYVFGTNLPKENETMICQAHLGKGPSIGGVQLISSSCIPMKNLHQPLAYFLKHLNEKTFIDDGRNHLLSVGAFTLLAWILGNQYDSSMIQQKVSFNAIGGMLPSEDNISLAILFSSLALLKPGGTFSFVSHSVEAIAKFIQYSRAAGLTAHSFIHSVKSIETVVLPSRTREPTWDKLASSYVVTGLRVNNNFNVSKVLEELEIEHEFSEIPTEEFLEPKPEEKIKFMIEEDTNGKREPEL